MTESVARFDLYLNTPETGLIKAARVGLQEDHGVLSRFQLRYETAYLDHPQAFALDPALLPLTPHDSDIPCRAGGMPAILDDYLPDAWGKRVLARLAFYKKQQRLREQSPLDMLSMIGNSRIGALQWVPVGENPAFQLGADIERIADAEKTAQAIESENFLDPSADEYSLAYLANAGTGVGGARPKALVQDAGQAYLAKFNSLSGDVYNNARVELACLKMAKAAGICMPDASVLPGINGREVLLIERFDVVGDARRHLVTVNGLLKNPQNQCDRGGAFAYDDVARLIRKYSHDPEADLEQLLALMLFNAGINNTDDHERNFSFWHVGIGYALAPAYDLVPSLSLGQYHIAGYNYSPYPLMPNQAAGRVFGLSATLVKRVAEQVSASLRDWLAFAESAGVSEEDSHKINAIISRALSK